MRRIRQASRLTKLAPLTAACLLLSGAALGPARSAVDAATPRTLVNDRAVDAFAQNGDWVAWSSSTGAEACFKVHRLNLRTGRRETVGWEVPGSPNNVDACSYESVLLAIAANGTAVWAGFEDCCNHGYGSVNVAARGDKAKTLDNLAQEYHSWGDIPLVASSGNLLVFEVLHDTILKEIDGNRGWLHCLPADPCTFRVDGARTYRVLHGAKRTVPELPPAVLLGAGAGRLILGRADTLTTTDGEHLPHIDRAAPIEIRNATTGRLVTRFHVRGVARELALDEEIAVALVDADERSLIEWHDSHTGKSLGKVEVSGHASSVSVSGTTVVYRTGRTISALATDTRAISRLAAAKTDPIGLSVSGSRVAWAETGGQQGRIQALELPTASP